MMELMVQTLALAGFVAVGYAALVYAGRIAAPAWLGQNPAIKALRRDEALEALRLRLARGEITPEEFEFVRRTLEDAR